MKMLGGGAKLQNEEYKYIFIGAFFLKLDYIPRLLPQRAASLEKTAVLRGFSEYYLDCLV